MYTERWRKNCELTNMQPLIEKTPDFDTHSRPPEVLEVRERVGAIERLLSVATTPDERRLIELIDTVIDQAWRLDTGKALRGELRHLWRAEGRTEWGFYKAFHAVQHRRVTT